MKELKNKNPKPTNNQRGQNSVQDLSLETYEEASNSEGTGITIIIYYTVYNQLLYK